MYKLKTILSLCAITVFGFFASSCLDENGDITYKIRVNAKDFLVEKPPPFKIDSTKWKLVAFVDVENGTSKSPEYPDTAGWKPANIARLYTLAFNWDTTHRKTDLIGQSAAPMLFGYYSVDYNANILSMFIYSNLGPYIPIKDSELYVDVLTGKYSYSNPDTQYNYFPFELSKDTLQLYYDDNKKYLLFERRY